LIIVFLTVCSWFLLGIWYGWGYCFLTDWHWEVKERLGERGLPNSFIKYALDEIFNRSLRTRVIDTATLVVFIAVVIITVYMNFIRRGTKKVSSK
jgi:hypothetical protein